MSAAPDLRKQAFLTFEDYKSSSGGELASFRSGELFSENPDVYVGIVKRVCNYFAGHLSTINMNLNGASKSCIEIDPVTSDVMDQIMEGLFLLEDFADRVCNDFEDFKSTINKGPGKTNLPRECRIFFNDVEQAMANLRIQIQRIRLELSTYLQQKMSETERALRIVDLKKA